MRQLSKQFPEYGFDKNAGYGTKQHLKAIDQVGIINEHRRSEEHTSELQSPNCISYAVFCLKKKNKKTVEY